MNRRLHFYNRQILVKLVSICGSFACLSFSSLAQVEQEAELITGKQFPDGFGIERSSLSPDKRYGVLVPADFDHYDESKPQNKLVEVETGRPLALINADTGKAGFMNHGGIQPSRWSADGSFLLWEVAGKWSPRALVLLKIEDGKVKWQRNLLKMAQKEILARTRKFLPKDFAAFIAVDVAVAGKEDAPLSLPLTVHATYDSNPKAIEPPPSVYVHSEMEATIDSEGKFIVKNFRKE
jgi:hypothetical protein